MKSLFRITLATAALASASLVHAQTIPFADFQQVGGDKSFQFFNSGAASTFATQDTVTSSTTIPVNFTFLFFNNSGTINVALPANLTITSTVSAPAAFGLTASQPFSNVQMTFTGTGAVTGNLLTIFNSTGILGGELGSSTAGLDETHNGTTQLVNFSSDYIDFSGSAQRNYNLSLNNITSTGVGLANGGNGYLAAFQSNATGVFAASSLTPEPSTFALLGLGALGLIVRRRRAHF